MQPVKSVETARSKHLEVESKACEISIVEADIVDIFHLLLSYRVFISLFTVLITLSAVGSFFLSTPIYRADVKLVAVMEKDLSAGYSAQLGDLGGLAGFTGIDMQRGTQRQEAIAILDSRLLTMNFIRDEKLIPVLLPYEEDAGKVPSLLDAYMFFDKEVRSVFNDKRAGLVILSIEWEDAGQASTWANQLVYRANELLRSRAIQQSNAAIQYLTRQLKTTSVVELQQVIHRLIESEMKKVILANINTEYAFRIVDPAVVAEKAFKPLLIPRLVLGVLVGFILSFFIVLIFKMLKIRGSTSD